MHVNLGLVLRAAALICFGLAAAGAPTRINLVPLGLALLTLSLMV